MVRQLSNGPHFITTSPTVTTCHRCRRPVLAATVTGLDRHVDLATLTAEGELMALLERRATYELRGERLIRRTTLHIGNGERACPVLADHACKPVPEHLVDHVWDEVAVALARRLLGAAPVLPDNPPF